MKRKVYIETSVVIYLTARPSRDLIVAGHQQITHDWWSKRKDEFDLFASQLVVREAAAGDVEAASERLAILGMLPLLTTSPEAIALGRKLVDRGAMPEKAVEDSIHLAIAVINQIDFLLTWNCRHLANASMTMTIDRLCRAAGYEPVVICTPEQLLET